MDFPNLEITSEDEARVLVQNLVKDAERQLLIATFNRTINAGVEAEQFDRQAAKIKDGLARIKSDTSSAKYLARAPEHLKLVK